MLKFVVVFNIYLCPLMMLMRSGLPLLFGDCGQVNLFSSVVFTMLDVLFCVLVLSELAGWLVVPIKC
jgi:hypothetical protein